MKYIKVLGLAVVAAMAIMAFVGAGTASATLLCTTGTTSGGCPAGELPYSGPIVAKSTNAVLTGSIEEKCNSEVEGTTNSAGVGSITTLIFTKCSGFCEEAVGVNLNYTAEAITGTAPNGTMKTTKSGGEVGARLQKCLFGVTCTFTAKEVVLDVTGHTNPTEPDTIHAINEPLTLTSGSAFLCGETGTWNATYTLTTPSTGIALE